MPGVALRGGTVRESFFGLLAVGSSRTAYVIASILYMGLIFALSSLRISLPGFALGAGEEPNLLGRVLLVAINVMHVPLFGGLAWLVHRAVATRRGRLRATPATYLAAVAIVFAYSIVDELHQSLTPGRVPSAFDVVLNLAGAALALGLARYGWRRFWIAGAAILLFSVLVVEASGRLAEEERRFWRSLSQDLSPIGRDGVLSRFCTTRRWGAFPPEAIGAISLRRLAGGEGLSVSLPTGRHLGIRSKSMPVDWSGFSELVLEVDNQSPRELVVALGLEPFGGETGVERRPLPPGRHALRFPLAELGARAELDRVRSVRFLIDRLDAPTTLRFTRLRLERALPGPSGRRPAGPDPAFARCGDLSGGAGRAIMGPDRTNPRTQLSRSLSHGSTDDPRTGTHRPGRPPPRLVAGARR